MAVCRSSWEKCLLVSFAYFFVGLLLMSLICLSDRNTSTHSCDDGSGVHGHQGCAFREAPSYSSTCGSGSTALQSTSSINLRLGLLIHMMGIITSARKGCYKDLVKEIVPCLGPSVHLFSVT